MIYLLYTVISLFGFSIILFVGKGRDLKQFSLCYGLCFMCLCVTFIYNCSWMLRKIDVVLS